MVTAFSRKRSGYTMCLSEQDPSLRENWQNPLWATSVHHSKCLTNSYELDKTMHLPLTCPSKFDISHIRACDVFLRRSFDLWHRRLPVCSQSKAFKSATSTWAQEIAYPWKCPGITDEFRVGNVCDLGKEI